ncbi:TetR/AcrR family transcriptional regulator [uncultured Friedmanniella sp.]|uniref:TetR/AcrR family transcriptional regulator n=1 Tax=uncultured Friedmanniella sp. TaxID=335381 RepID=UPI0035CBD134
MATGVRDRMIESAVELLQRRGLAGMSFTEVLAASGGARGAIYHHFPGGKEQLARAAADRNARMVLDHLSRLPEDTAHTLASAFFDSVRPVVAASAQGGGCAVAAVTVDSGGSAGTLLATAASAFDSWIDQLSGKFSNAGLSRDEARNAATLLITVLQGAHVLCRTAQTLEPFDRAVAACLPTFG